MAWKLLRRWRMISFSKNRAGQRGTKEWSDKSYNILLGCKHGCRYCYAKQLRCWSDAGMRKPGAWELQRLNPNRSRLGAEVKDAGVVMFPTSHDLTPDILPQSLEVVRNLLANRNKVLLVTKPHFEVVSSICAEFSDRKPAIMFRFTIGSLDPELTAWWEPGAPPPAERLKALSHAFGAGFQTSVSCEPYLSSVEETRDLVLRVLPHVSDTVWVGRANRVPRRLNAHVPGFARALATLQSHQTDSEVLRLVRMLSGQKKVRWKDSIQVVLDNTASARGRN